MATTVPTINYIHTDCHGKLIAIRIVDGIGVKYFCEKCKDEWISLLEPDNK